ncbi:type III secretion system inner membrane ring subunit SctD [Pleionea sediminis]|uniref:type III secretion system inner membrane ring subunit SctD n=1 Tax=Pleionea sediminis TaxID=2569479 RepID=UPI0013DE0613|nr:type III secretion system inner membrane ring subunit SctD [Pleionea sediminis]
MNTTTWKLIIANTAHAGAEVYLTSSMHLGSGEEHNDIVIDDPSIPEHFFTLALTDDGIRIDQLDSNYCVVCLGHSITEDQLLPMQHLIQVGDLLFALAEVEDTWSEVILNQINNCQSGKSAPSLNWSQWVIAPVLSVLVMVLFIDRIYENEFSDWLGVTVGLSSPETHHPNNEATPNKLTYDADSLIQEKNIHPDHQLILGLTQFSAIESYGPDARGYFTIQGYVEQEADRALLQYLLKEKSAPIHFKVYSYQQMVNSAHLIAKNLGLDANDIAKDEKPGSLKAIVDGRYTQQWEVAKKTMLRDIPGLKSWRILIPKKLNPIDELSSLLKEENLLSLLTLTSNDSEITATGTLTNNQQKRLLDVIKNFRDMMGDSPSIRYQRPIIEDSAPNIKDLDIVAVRSGNTPYITLTDGSRYTIGAKLPNGDSLYRISSGQISILSDGKLIAVEYLNKTKPEWAHQPNTH